MILAALGLADLAYVVTNRQIYILGRSACNTFRKYDAEETEWTSLAGMLKPRSNSGACVIGDEIYMAVVGGETHHYEFFPPWRSTT